MVFSSAIFLFAFLPIVFGLCMLPVSIKIKNIVLIIASLFFYAFGEPVYVLLMIGSSIWNYIFGYMLGPSSEGKAKYRKIVLVIAVIVNIGMLGVFKYTGFITTPPLLLGREACFCTEGLLRGDSSPESLDKGSSMPTSMEEAVCARRTASFMSGLQGASSR